METESVTLLTREVFGNVSTRSKGLFYVFSLLSLAAFTWGTLRRARLWRLGAADTRSIDARSVARNLWNYVLRQQRVRGRGAAGAAHRMLFGGFLVLLTGTVLIAVEHVLATLLGRGPRDPVFHRGVYFAVYEFALDTAGLSFLGATAYFAVRRYRGRHSIAHDRRDWVVLALFATIGLSGYVLEGLRIIREQTPLPGFSYVGYLVSVGFEALGVAAPQAARWHIAGWWLHAILSLGLIAWFPYSRLLHALAGTLHLAQGIEPPGALAAVALDRVEETGELGVARIDQFTWRQLLALDACVSCGRCEDACPAFEAGKPLSPRDVVQDLRQALDRAAPARPAGASTSPPAAQPIAGEVISVEAIWSCTNCAACVDVCPLGISPLGYLTDVRRGLVAEGQLRGAPATALQRLGRSGNPWGLPPQDRMRWAADLDLPTTATEPDFEVLYWIGCAAAYDKRLQRVARSVIRLLRAAGIRFAVLGNLERCTGEAARRMGDELLFQQLAAENIANLDRAGLNRRARRIVSHCPHCVNSLTQDYAQAGADFDVVHHTQFLVELVRAGRLAVAPQAAAAVTTFHDPCFLARAAGITDAPRELVTLSIGKDQFVELPRHGRQTACCGAGGGRMWFDDAAETRIGRTRVDEVLAGSARTLAVGCPFCLIMLTDGLAARAADVPVRDVAEILCEALLPEQETPDGL